jgi:hypothetical protein
VRLRQWRLERTAGKSARKVYLQRQRIWRDRVRGRALLASALVFALILPLTLISPSWWRFDLGLALGAAMAFYMAIMDELPEHVDRWRRGSGGERRTARALRPLSRVGWVVRHDLAAGRGNRDHVVVGPAGVFLLDSKTFGGEVTVADDVLAVRWLEDLDDGYELPRLGARMRGAAAGLAADLSRASGVRAWVQPVVVIWAPFAQSVVEEQGVVYIGGESLVDWMRGLPDRMAATTAAKVGAAVAEARAAA